MLKWIFILIALVFVCTCSTRTTRAQAQPDTSGYAMIYEKVRAFNEDERPDSVKLYLGDMGFEARPSTKAEEVLKLSFLRSVSLGLRVIIDPEDAAQKEILYVYDAHHLQVREAWETADSFREGFSILDEDTVTALSNDSLTDFRIQIVTFETSDRDPAAMNILCETVLEGAAQNRHYIVTDHPIEGARHSLKVIGVVNNR